MKFIIFSYFILTQSIYNINFLFILPILFFLKPNFKKIFILLILLLFLFLNFIYLVKPIETLTFNVSSDLKIYEYGSTFIHKQNFKKILISTDYTNLDYQSSIICKKTSIENIENKFKNDSSFNYKKFMLSKKVIYKIKAEQCEIKKISTNKVSNFRHNLIEKTKSRYIHGDLISALTIGNTDIKDDSYNSFINTNLIHLIVISTGHLNIIISSIYFLTSKLSITKKKANYFILIFLFLFYFIAGRSIPLLKATICSILNFTKLNKKKNLYYSFIIIIISNPFLIYSLSFQFTYIIALTIFYSDKLPKFSSNVNVNLSIQIFFILLPITISLNNQVNPLTFFINIIYSPLISYVYFPLSLLVIVLLEFGIYLNIVDKLFEILLSSLNLININITFRTLSFLETIFYYAIIFSLNKYKNHYYILIIFFLINYFNFRFMNHIYFLDVDQSKCFVIQTKGFSKTILIDTSDAKYSSEVVDFLKYKGVKNINSIFLTHDHEDHIGGLDDILKNFSVNNIFVNKYSKLEYTKINYPTKIKIKNLTFDVISTVAKSENENNNSLIIKSKLGKYNYLFTGDIEKNIEQWLIKNYNLNDIDILDVPHHGSKTSSSQKFIKHLEPKIAILSYGENNLYNHPHPTTLENLNGIKTLHTKDQMIHFKFH